MVGTADAAVLRVAWDANSETDLRGYVLMVGTSTETGRAARVSGT
jgi:hypothetical protein